KGCYLGQEIMARIEARGRVKRGLARLTFDREPQVDRSSAPGGDGNAVRDEAGRSVGRLGTIVVHPDRGAMALAVLRFDAVERTLRCGDATVREVRWPDPRSAPEPRPA
ncbi:MAG: hypothetical protein WD336_09075, partial [Trueperaceae bacterium]